MPTTSNSNGATLGAAGVSAPAPLASSRPALGNGVVIAYTLAALLILLPGLLLKAEMGLDWPVAGPALSYLQAALIDIKFGSGIRFWLGVAGGTMMGLLLFYPLRKAFLKARGLGSVASWFHVHIVLGLAGPVLILYHANFGHGGSNANVALWTMIIVAVSGILGFFVYGRVSRDFYGARQQAHRHREAIIAALPDFDHTQPWKEKLVRELELFEADHLAARQGIVANIQARLRMEQAKRDLSYKIAWVIDESLRRNIIPRDEHSRLRSLIGGHARHYFGIARAATGPALREQLWSRWRLFHLPVFVMMTVATVLHVAAVWDMDGPAPAGIEEKADANDAAQPDPIEFALKQYAEVEAEQSAAKAAVETSKSTVKLNIDKLAAARESEVPVKTVKPTTIAVAPPVAVPRPKPVTQSTSEQASEAPPLLVAKPTPAVRPKPPVEVARAVTPPPVAAKPPQMQPPQPPRSDPPPSSKPDDGGAAVAELRRREMQPSMSLGNKPRTLLEQIAEYKEKRANKEFMHSLAETGFALKGKHVKVECAECHKVPLKETRATTVRECIACHKKDDVHRGRRPDCASCHTENRWSQIIRRR